MTTLNTIEDLARILKEQPTWAEALRALVLSEDLLDLPARFDRFVETQGEVNARLEQNIAALQESYARIEKFIEEQQETNRLVSLRLNNMEGRLGNLDGGEYERRCRARALSRTLTEFGFVGAYFALHQGGHADPRLMGAVDRAANSGAVPYQRSGDLFETDVIISTEDNLHAVFEISLTADNDDIHRARARAEILAEVTGGRVTPAVMTANLSEPQQHHADAENVTVFVVPHSR